MTKRFKKILVTGGAGFICSEFVRQAIDRKYQIVVVDKLSYAGDLARLKDIKGKFQFCKTDIADKKALFRILQKEKIPAVVHFAAESHVDRSILDASDFIRTNVEGTQCLLQACQQAGIEKFIHLSTDEVYGEIEKGAFREDSPLKPNSPYSASKAAADFFVQAFIRTYQFPAVILRPSNNYGPGQYPEKFIPVIIYKALRNEKVPVYAHGENIREWLHIADCSRAVMTALERGKVGEAYNIGSGNERKNIHVVKAILKILNKPEELIAFVQDRPGHDLRYALNFNKIQHELGWRPQIDFESGLPLTVAWYQKNFRWLESKVKFLHNYWKQVYKF